MRVTSIIARKMLEFFFLAIPISIAKSPNLIRRQIYRLYSICSQANGVCVVELAA